VAYVAEEDPAASVGFGRVVGRVHGRSGSFLLPRTATSAGSSGERSAAWSVAPSATGELLGLRGEARIINEPVGGHSFSPDYDFIWLLSRVRPPARARRNCNGFWPTLYLAPHARFRAYPWGPSTGGKQG
jgi:hypothetical protein